MPKPLPKQSTIRTSKTSNATSILNWLTNYLPIYQVKLNIISDPPNKKSLCNFSEWLAMLTGIENMRAKLRAYSIKVILSPSNKYSSFHPSNFCSHITLDLQLAPNNHPKHFVGRADILHPLM